MSSQASRAPPLNLLLVDDDAGERFLCRSNLARIEAMDIAVQECESAESAIQMLDGADVGCILLDLNLPQTSGFELLELLKQRFEVFPPVIVLTSDPAPSGVRALKLGAVDYLHKDQASPDALRRSISYAMERARCIALDKRVELSERVAAVGQLAAGVAHEINNPAAYVAANLEVMGKRLAQLQLLAERENPTAAQSLGGDLLTLLSECAGGIDRIATICSDLRSFSNVGPESVRKTTLTRVAETAARLFHPSVGARRQVELDLRSAHSFFGNEGKLVQVVINLLSNAHDAAPAVGPRVILRTLDTPSGCALEVDDNGSGVDPKQAERIFAPFFTTKRPGAGTGLGLALSAEYVKLHRGTVEVQRSSSGGARFRINIPADTGFAAVPEARQEILAAAPRSRILLVDDEPLILKSIQRLLMTDHDVEVASTVQAALELIEANDFDVVLCDVNLGESRGTDLHRIVQSKRPELFDRFIFWSGGPIPEGELNQISEPGCQLLPKPAGLDELRHAVNLARRNLRRKQ